MVIVLAGMIGTGKSSYTKMIAKSLETTAFYEQVDANQILAKFYAEPKRWAFALQIYFLNERFKSIKLALTNQNNVLDRSIYEDALFTKINYQSGNITAIEMNIYQDLLANMMEELSYFPQKAPDLLIYLHGSLKTVLARIKKRGRSYEQIEGKPELLAYYKTLHAQYEDWFKSYDKSPTLVFNIDEIDIAKPSDQKKVMQQIHNRLA